MRRALGLAAVITTGLVLGAATPASAAAVGLTLSSNYGPGGIIKTLIGTVPSTVTGVTFAAGVKPVVQFQYSTCSIHASAITQITSTNGTATTAGVQTVDPAKVTRISGSKIAFQIPTGSYPAGNNLNTSGVVLVNGQTAARWNICVYDTDSALTSTLLATAQYTLSLKPTIATILPATSPSAGGQTITVNGTGFTGVAPITGSIGGVPLSNIRAATTGTSLTAVTGAHAAGPGMVVTINAPGGTVTSADPNGDGSTGDAIDFTYSNGITVSPHTASRGSVVTVDITGAGFSVPTFEPSIGTPGSGNAHIFLVNGAYDSSSNRGVAECTGVTVVSDNELVCTLDLSINALDPQNSNLTGAPVPDGAYIMTWVADGTQGSTGANPSIISSGSDFVVAPY
ncbi:hypothetical protein ACWT_6575 [Actinoplanes sp. SE50]|uniref:IPT/TIG domain-containing protein n=1 Tax=unclassified Actinoplanes TaxID=2626549 RepID=UPI00023EC518|nr:MULTISPECIES: IPT/TIG domain-containing protein [unclassified Actinoplanes]AEV87587.1 hypothetical protein ACPL_6705 [Actinoplanes sp. SE50/110]ATO85990.1 hypothetical protein ACWT_6575 [Actinoplanes sp. SE50]SLM03404.1 hypothetical protein ACSP50_6693 [Actinoplanes sp. SE50/110]